MQGGEPTLDQVDPGRPGGGKVQMVARMAHQPAVDQRGLVCAIVVQNQMHVQFGGRHSVDRVQKLTELDGAMPPMTLPNDPTASLAKRILA